MSPEQDKNRAPQPTPIDALLDAIDRAEDRTDEGYSILLKELIAEVLKDPGL